MRDLYRYQPSKATSFGHVPMTKDPGRLFANLRGFLAEHAHWNSIRAEAVVTHDTSGPELQRRKDLHDRIDKAFSTRFGVLHVPDPFGYDGAAVEPCANILADIFTWPDLAKPGVNIILCVTFTWRRDDPVDPEHPLAASSFLSVHFWDPKPILQPSLVYRSWDTAKSVEGDFTNFKLFRLNPTHYRFNGKKLKPAK
jgi:hypothetical protein